MVYLIAATVAAAVTSLLLSSYGIWLLRTLPRGGSGEGNPELAEEVRSLRATVTDQSRTLAEMREVVPVIRAEVAEALTRVDSRFNAARAAEERTRRIARNAAEEEDRGDTLSEQEFLALAQSSAPEEPDSHQLAWPDLERLAFERRNQGRR